jgi:hypothetical protein
LVAFHHGHARIRGAEVNTDDLSHFLQSPEILIAAENRPFYPIPHAKFNSALEISAAAPFSRP